jgi:hypothetical protein
LTWRLANKQMLGRLQTPVSGLDFAFEWFALAMLVGIRKEPRSRKKPDYPGVALQLQSVHNHTVSKHRDNHNSTSKLEVVSWPLPTLT